MENQASYDINGNVITNTIAAGTADRYKPMTIRLSWVVHLFVEYHYRYDVVPFLRAISLDGNPGVYNYRYAPTDIAANKDIAAKTTTTDASADARISVVLMVVTIKKNEALERYSTNDAHRHPF